MLGLEPLGADPSVDGEGEEDHERGEQRHGGGSADERGLVLGHRQQLSETGVLPAMSGEIPPGDACESQQGEGPTDAHGPELPPGELEERLGLVGRDVLVDAHLHQASPTMALDSDVAPKRTNASTRGATKKLPKLSTTKLHTSMSSPAWTLVVSQEPRIAW